MAGVRVEWQLMDNSFKTVYASGTETTGEGGGYKIRINEQLPLENNQDYPILIKFSKNSTSGNETVGHTFRCDLGLIDCTSTGTTIFVKHLDFDVPVVAYDSVRNVFV